MLKITTHTDVKTTTFALEGRLAGPWVAELERCWSTAPVMEKGQSVRVDLTGVTYIDAEGKALLVRMHREGAELIAAGCLTRCIVEEITRSGPFDKATSQGCGEEAERQVAGPQEEEE